MKIDLRNIGAPARLKPEYEFLLETPAMVKAIEWAAKKDKLGPNPFFDYIWQKIGHFAWHLTGIGRSKDEQHPELKYPSLEALLNASREHLGAIGGDIPYYFRSILQRANPKVVKATDIARENLRRMGRTRIDPESLAIARQRSAEFSQGFTIIVSGLEEKMRDGQSTAEHLRNGKCLIYENHPSLTQLYLNFPIFEKVGINNVLTIAGDNLLKGMRDRQQAAYVENVLLNSGVLFIDRKAQKGQSKPYLYHTSIVGITGLWLANGYNVQAYTNNGREKFRSAPDTRTVTTLAAMEADYIVVATYSFDKIPDDKPLATGGKTGTFDDLFNMGGSGRVFVNFAKPLNAKDYFSGLSGISKPNDYEQALRDIKRKIESDVADCMKTNLVFTPTYVLAEAALCSGMHQFNLADIQGNFQAIVSSARENSYPLAPELMGVDLSQPMKSAADILVEREALAVSGQMYAINQEPILGLYAAKIEPSLKLARK